MSGMKTITKGVEFNVIAREWRMKWDTEDDKASLQAIQAEVDKILPAVKAVKGFIEVQRVVCGNFCDTKHPHCRNTCGLPLNFFNFNFSRWLPRLQTHHLVVCRGLWRLGKLELCSRRDFLGSM